MEQRILKFSGAVSYSALRTGSVARRFDFIDTQTVLFEFVSAAEGQLTTRIIGVAELMSGESFRSPWIRLTKEDGSDLSLDVDARLEFSIQDLTVSDLEVKGRWIYPERSFEFRGFLQACI